MKMEETEQAHSAACDPTTKSLMALPSEETGSYFPPVEEYWATCKAKRAVTREAASPILPTPLSNAATLTLGEPLREVPPTVIDLELIKAPTCSCPRTDSCVTETLALLLGSFNILTFAAKYKGGSLPDTPSWLVKHEGPGNNRFACSESRRLEKCIFRLLPPPLNDDDVDISTLLRDRWRGKDRNTAGVDLCSSLRQNLSNICIDPVDLFAPMQHSIHILLALQGFTDPMFQSRLEEMKDKDDLPPDVALLLEANSQLSLFEIKATSLEQGVILKDLNTKLEELERHINIYEPVLARKDSGMDS